MAEKLIRRFDYNGGSSLAFYALFFRATDGKVWGVSTNTWVTFVDANIANYVVDMVELGSYSKIYTADVPTNAAFGAGRFTAVFQSKDGGTYGVDDHDASFNMYGFNGGHGLDFNYDGAKVVNALNYFCRVGLNIDNGNSKDEYTVQWFRNTEPIGADASTTPQIKLVKRSDGSNLLAATNMTQVASLTHWKYDATTTARLTAGEAAIAVITATIDGVVRTFEEPVSRDA